MLVTPVSLDWLIVAVNIGGKLKKTGLLLYFCNGLFEFAACFMLNARFFPVPATEFLACTKLS